MPTTDPGAVTGYLLEINGRLADVCPTRERLVEAVRTFGDDPRLAVYWLDRSGERFPLDVRGHLEQAEDVTGTA